MKLRYVPLPSHACYVSDILNGKAKVNEETENVTRLNAEMDALGNVTDLMEQKDDLQVESRQNRSLLNDYIVQSIFHIAAISFDIHLFLGRYETHGHQSQSNQRPNRAP
jgi:hypothetical protein